MNAKEVEVIRDFLGMTRQEFSKATKFYMQHIYKVEKGKVECSQKLENAILEVMKDNRTIINEKLEIIKKYRK